LKADKTQCKSIEMSDKNKEWCFTCAIDNADPTPHAFIYLMNLKMTPEQAEQFAIRLYEVDGFTKANKNTYTYAPFNHTYDCPSQKYTVTYDYEVFTDEEKELFKKDNYCLRLYYEGLYELNLISELKIEQKAITKEDCSNAVMIPSKKNIETCAFASLDFLLLDGSTKHLILVYIFPKDLLIQKI